MLKKQQQTDKKVEEARIAKKRAETFACRRCSAKYFSNIKLHEHIRDHHAKKSKSVSNSSISFISSSTSSESIIFLSDSSKSASQSKTLSISSFSLSQSVIVSLNFISSISIFSSFFTSKRLISLKRSSLSDFASEFVLKRSESASSISQKSVTMQSTFFFKSIFATFTKLYLTMNDLFRRFVEKFKSISLQQHQKHQFFSRIFDISKRDFMQARIIVYFLSISKSTKFEVFTSVYDSIKQSIRISSSRSSSFSSRFFLSIRFLFSKISYFVSVC